jgi:hypothetical protein
VTHAAAVAARGGVMTVRELAELMHNSFNRRYIDRGGELIPKRFDDLSEIRQGDYLYVAADVLSHLAVPEHIVCPTP